MPRPRSLGTTALLALSSLLIALTSVAGAAPTAGFDLGGSAGQTVGEMAPGADGSVWVEQESDSGLQLKRVSASGTVAATSEGIPGATTLSPLSAAPDGSAWLVGAGGLRRVAPDGTTSQFALPANMWLPAPRVALDSDSNAWTLGCMTGSGTYTCSALRFAPDGTVTTIELPSFNFGPSFLVSVRTDVDIFAVPGGVWINRTRWTTELFVGESATAFVSGAGEVTPVDIGLNTRLIAPAPGGKAWWMRWPSPKSAGETPSLTFGQVTQDQNVLPASDAVAGDFNATPPLLGSNSEGDLLYALNHTPSQGWVGSFSGSLASVQSTPPMKTIRDRWRLCSPFATFDAACDFDRSIAQTTDGAIWMLASPDAPQVGRLAADGSWSSFSPFTGHVGAISVTGMTQSTDDAVWFAFDTADGAHMVSRADPTDPPADETPAVPVDPTGPTGAPDTTQPPAGGTVGAKATTPAASEAELQTIAQTVRSAARKWRGGKFSSKVFVSFPRYGRLDLTIRSGNTVLAKVAKTRSAGSHKIKLKVGTAGRKLLKHHRSVKVTLTAVFSTAGYGRATSTLAFRL